MAEIEEEDKLNTLTTVITIIHQKNKIRTCNFF
jgi:hypothetical protein